MNPGQSGESGTGGVSAGVCRALAGLDVGMSAALGVLAWLMVHSWLRGEYWWSKLNVAGGFFFGPDVYRMGVGRATLAGVSLLLLVYTLLGLAYAAAARTEGYGRNLLMALAWSGAWHLVAERWFWTSLDAFGPAYFPVLATVPAHLIMALCLARFAARHHSLAASFGDPAWVELPAEPVAEQVPEEALPEAAGPPDERPDERPIVD